MKIKHSKVFNRETGKRLGEKGNDGYEKSEQKRAILIKTERKNEVSSATMCS